MIRCDKTFSELWNLTESEDILTVEAAKMAINTINKLHEENQRYETALKEIERWDRMLYSSRELGNFAKKALGLPTIPLKD